MTLDEVLSVFQGANLTEEQQRTLKQQISIEMISSIEDLLNLIPYMDEAHIDHMLAEFITMKELAEKRRKKVAN